MTKVKLFGNLPTYSETASLDIAGTNVCAVVATLCERNSALRQALLKDRQIRPHFIIDTLEEGRQLVARSFPLKEFHPRHEAAWDDAYERFTALDREIEL